MNSGNGKDSQDPLSPLIGIDLGTTHSLCAIYHPDRNHRNFGTSSDPTFHKDPRAILIPNAHGESLTPSVVAIVDNTVLVGSAAKELQITQPDLCASNFKRHMGSEWQCEIAGISYGAVELSALVLSALRKDAEAALDTVVTRAVITVPAYFNEHQRQATKRAGELAGLQVERIINEPTAAALSYGCHQRSEESKLLIFDLGGGTFDVTVMEIFEGTLEILATAGESQLGGEDFTDRLVAVALREQGQQLEVVEFKFPKQLARLRAEAELAKRQFCHRSQVELRMPQSDGQFDAEHTVFSISSDQYRQHCEVLFERLRTPLIRAIADSKLRTRDIDMIIMVGGATRLPHVQEFVQEFFNLEPSQLYDPDRVVAYGAAMQTALMLDCKEVRDVVLTDVCPFTLGVEIVKEFASQIREGYFLPIIHRNTTIPVSREEIVHTVYDGQSEILVRVYQGEGRKTRDNLFLGELRVPKIPSAPAGTSVHLRFTYDINGLLEIEAFLPSADRKYRAVLTQHAAGLSGRDLKRATAKLQRLKFYPRDDHDNRRLLHFAERRVGEVSQFERAALEEIIDQFEHAMGSGNREQFEQAEQALTIELSRLGYDPETAIEDGRQGDEPPRFDPS